MMEQTNILVLAEQQERELPRFLRSWWPLTYSSVSLFRVERARASCAAQETAYQKFLVLDVSWWCVGANNDRFLRHGILQLERLALPLSDKAWFTGGRRGFCFGCRAAVDALLSSVLQIWHLFYTVMAWLMSYRSQAKIAGQPLY